MSKSSMKTKIYFFIPFCYTCLLLSQAFVAVKGKKKKSFPVLTSEILQIFFKFAVTVGLYPHK